MMIYANGLKYERQGYTPFMLTLNDAVVAERFYAGDLIIYVFVDMHMVETHLSSFGLTVSASSSPEFVWEVSSLQASPADVGIREWKKKWVSYHPIGRLGAEFVSLEWLLSTIIHMCNEVPEAELNQDDLKL